jgi:pimeloyl-ACP methyl ester carboxylesterase
MTVTAQLRRRRPAILLGGLVLVLVAALLGAGTATATSSASAPAGHRRLAAAAHPTSGASSVKPTVVLVHGAFADASGWSAEVRALQALGYPVIAPANPLRGLTSDADYVRSVLLTITGPIVLVGHSYGGAVITNAARGVPGVKALVYVGAFVPDDGENITNAYDPVTYPGALLGPSTTLVRPAPNPAADGGSDLDIYIDPTHFREVFAGDVSEARADVMAAVQRPLSLTANTEASGAPAWRTVPSWDLITLDDKAISPGGQRFMAERAGSHVRTVHSAHDVMVSHPAAVLRTILAAAHSVR